MKKLEPDFQHEFEFLGQKIVVKTAEESALAKSAISMATRKVNELKMKNPNLVSHQLAVLALLEISGDLVRDRKKMTQYRSELDQRCNELMLNLNQLANSSVTERSAPEKTAV